MLTIDKPHATPLPAATIAAPIARPPRLLDRMRSSMRVRHYSLATERTYIGWVKRFIYFHQKRHPADMGAAEVEAFLSALATELEVSASTQNQAMHAILFLYRDVLGVTLPWLDGITRAKINKRLPVVLTVAETQALLRRLPADTNGLIIRLLYGTGMRIKECLRLRIKDVDLARGEIIVREGKGGKDRVTMLPATLVPALTEHLAERRRWHDIDLATGHADVELPDAIERKYPKAGAEWAWQYIFAAPTYSTDPRSGRGCCRPGPWWRRGVGRQCRRAACRALVPAWRRAAAARGSSVTGWRCRCARSRRQVRRGSRRRGQLAG